MEYVIAVAATPWLSPLPTRLGKPAGASTSPHTPRKTPSPAASRQAPLTAPFRLPPDAAPAPTPASTGNGIQAP